MKKSVAIIVLLLYGLLSVGIQLHLHYCCGKLSDAGFFHAKKCCSEGNESSSCDLNKQCCKFEDVSFKIHDSHSSSFFFFAFLKPCIIAHAIHFAHVPLSANFVVDFNKVEPPGKIPIFIRQQKLIYYA